MAARERKAEAARILVFARADKRDRPAAAGCCGKTKAPATISRRGRHFVSSRLAGTANYFSLRISASVSVVVATDLFLAVIVEIGMIAKRPSTMTDAETGVPSFDL